MTSSIHMQIDKSFYTYLVLIFCFSLECLYVPMQHSILLFMNVLDGSRLLVYVMTKTSSQTLNAMLPINSGCGSMRMSVNLWECIFPEISPSVILLSQTIVCDCSATYGALRKKARKSLNAHAKNLVMRNFRLFNLQSSTDETVNFWKRMLKTVVTNRI